MRTLNSNIGKHIPSKSKSYAWNAKRRCF